MTMKQKNKKLKKRNKELKELVEVSVAELVQAADDIDEARGNITYMAGQIAAYRDCLKLDR